MAVNKQRACMRCTHEVTTKGACSNPRNQLPEQLLAAVRVSGGDGHAKVGVTAFRDDHRQCRHQRLVGHGIECPHHGAGGRCRVEHTRSSHNCDLARDVDEV